MLRYGRGDLTAFKVLYARHRGPLFRYLLRQCQDRSVAEELFQDVWLRLIYARDRYEPRSKFTAYLYRIAHNRVVDHFRRASVRRDQNHASHAAALDTLAADPAGDPAHRAQLAEQTMRLLAALDGLPPEQRETLLLREEAGMSLDEIAEITGVSIEAAKSRLRYAVSRLRRALGETP